MAVTRRRLFSHAARLAAATFATMLMPPAVQKAMADPVRLDSLASIKHVVLLMQENRSFDHYFGTLPGVRGFGDPNPLLLPSGNSVFRQPDPLGEKRYLLPFHLDTLRTSAQRIPSTSHEWDVLHASYNDGAMDGWVTSHRSSDGKSGPFCMGYYERADIPFHFALAEAFTVCDAYHCSVLGPTWPNRLYWMTGTLDPEGRGHGLTVDNTVPTGGWGWTTYAERLQAAGVSWKVYQEADNYDCNVLEYFTGFIHEPHGSPLYERGVRRGPPLEFEHDAMADRLPTVSWIIPREDVCEHPDQMPASGAAYIASKISAIASNPDVWASTVFILCYDENDGLFDHVPPPVAPPDTPLEFVRGLPIGAGFRVPCIVVSPWTVGGWVCSDLFDHTSILRFLERITGVPEPNVSDWRRQTFGDMTSVFRWADPLAAPALPDADALLAAAGDQVRSLPEPVIDELAPVTPEQEDGTRPHVGSTPLR